MIIGVNKLLTECHKTNIINIRILVNCIKYGTNSKSIIYLEEIHMNRFRLEQRLRELNEIIKSGKATQAIIEEQFEIQLLLDNVFYID